jgi:hypothetical protein
MLVSLQNKRQKDFVTFLYIREILCWKLTTVRGTGVRVCRLYVILEAASLRSFSDHCYHYENSVITILPCRE